MNRGYRIFGWIAVAVSVAYLARTGFRQAGELMELPLSAGFLAGLVAGVGLYGLALVSGTVAWMVLVRGLGAPLLLRPAVAMVLRSNAAKYLPGNVGHYLGRTALARVGGTPLRIVVVSLSLEAVLTVVAGVLFALSVAPAVFTRALAAHGREITDASVILPVLVVVGIGVAAMRWYRTTEGLPGSSSLLAAFALFTANFALLGLAVTLVARYSVGIEPSGYASLAGAFAVAWVGGFAVPGSPGGLGVREALLVAALGPSVGSGPALALALLFRLVTVAGDGAALAVGLALPVSSRSAPAEEAT